MARGSDKEAGGGEGGGGSVEGNDDHSDPEMSGSGHKKKFLSALRFQFDLKISGGSHEKFYFVLLQRTDYIYSP